MQLNEEKIDYDQLNEVMEMYNRLTSSSHIMPTIYLMEFSSRKILMISENIKNITGYDTTNFLEGGMDFFISIYHKADFAVFNHKIFPKNLKTLTSIPIKDHDKCIFSYDFRIHTKENELLRLHLRSTYITSAKTGIPHYIVGIVSDINHLKKGTSISHQIEKIHYNATGTIHQMLHDEVYYPDVQLFSRREIEVLKWMSEGFNSIEIAQKLAITESTVTNHRKSMLTKSNSKNIAQLITFGIRNHII